MGLFDRFKRRRDDDDVPSTRGPSPAAITEMKQFLLSREGLEGFVEPPTQIYAMTLLLVAGDGEYLRRPVKNLKQAEKICGDAGIPLYEARKVGYPQRMKDFERGIKRRSVSLEELPPLEVTEERED